MNFWKGNLALGDLARYFIFSVVLLEEDAVPPMENGICGFINTSISKRKTMTTTRMPIMSAHMTKEEFKQYLCGAVDKVFEQERIHFENVKKLRGQP